MVILRVGTGDFVEVAAASRGSKAYFFFDERRSRSIVGDGMVTSAR